MEHDWESRAFGENGYYHWHCRGCGKTLPYPCASERFRGTCDNHLRERRSDSSETMAAGTGGEAPHRYHHSGTFQGGCICGKSINDPIHVEGGEAVL